MTRKTDHAYIVGHILAAELCSESDFVGLLEQSCFELDVAEGTAGLIAAGRQTVIVMGGSQLHGEKVLLCRSAADHEGNVIRRAGCGAEALHLLHEERDEGTRILDTGLGLLIEITLVGRAAALGHHKETVFVTLGGLYIYLGREVALGIDLIVHVQRGILGVAEILLGVGLEDAEGYGLLILETCPYLLSLLAVHDCGAGILTERKLALRRNLGVAQESQGHIFVVGAGLRVAEYRGHLLVMRTAEQEAYVAEGGVGHKGKSLRADLQDSFSLKFAGRYELLGARNLVVLGSVFAKLEHWRVFEFCHFYMYMYWFIFLFTGPLVAALLRMTQHVNLLLIL